MPSSRRDVPRTVIVLRARIIDSIVCVFHIPATPTHPHITNTQCNVQPSSQDVEDVEMRILRVVDSWMDGWMVLR